MKGGETYMNRGEGEDQLALLPTLLLEFVRPSPPNKLEELSMSPGVAAMENAGSAHRQR
jgi:hypothetical protein